MTYFDNAIGTLAEPSRTNAKARPILRDSNWGLAKALVPLERAHESIADFTAALKLDNGQKRAEIQRELDVALAKKATKTANARPTAKSKAAIPKSVSANRTNGDRKVVEPKSPAKKE